MATTVYYCASSLDGYIAGADDSLEWLLNYEGRVRARSRRTRPDERRRRIRALLRGGRVLVAGSVTYEWILDHLDVAGGGEWPYRGKPCWVLSSRELRLPEGDGVDVRIANASVGELYGEMAAVAGDRVLLGSRRRGRCLTVRRRGLLDEVHVTVVPVVLGAGKSLFERRLRNGAMQLTTTRTFQNGMVELRYKIGARGAEICQRLPRADATGSMPRGADGSIWAKREAPLVAPPCRVG